MSIATAALLVSILSLILSIYVVSRDRSRLKTESQAYINEETGEFSIINLKAVNTGRRPIILTAVQGVYEGKHRASSFIDYEDKGHPLNENEIYEYRLRKFDGMTVCDPDDSGTYYDLRDLYFIDSTGRRYHIKGAKKNVKLLKESKHPFGVRP